MPSFELLERVCDLASGGPGLDAPFAGSDRDPIVVTGAGANIVVNEMMLRPPPYVGRKLDSQVRYSIGGNQPAIGHVSRKSRRLWPHDGFTHSRVNTVCANHHVGISGRAVMELHLDAIRMLGEFHESMIQMQHALGHSR